MLLSRCLTYLFALMALFSVAACVSAPKHPSMLEVSARPWLYSLSEKYNTALTTLADIPDTELADIAQRGINIVWLMGVWTLGPYGLNHDRTDPGCLATFNAVLPDFTLDDVIGSPYAVFEYTCNPQLCPNGDTDLLAFRDRVNALGMLLMLDFVPNHSACDCEWTNQPDLYIQAPKGTTPPYNSSKYLPSGIAFGNYASDGNAWTDVAQLNYWNPATRKLMLTQLAHVASVANAVRCDTAHIVLNDIFHSTWGEQLDSWGWTRPADEFWAEAISAVKQQFPGTIMLGEVYGEDNVRTMQQWFDFVYDKDLLDKLKGGDYAQFEGWIAGIGLQYLSQAAHYVENHDEDRAVEVFGSYQRADAAAAITMTIPGMKFYWQDQWNGFKNKLEVHLRRAEDEFPIADAQTFYEALFRIVNASVFHDGTWTMLTPTGCTMLAYKWTLADQKRLVTVNFSNQRASGCWVVLNDIVGSGTVPILEEVAGIIYPRDAPTIRTIGLTVALAPWQTQIFSYP